MNELPTEATEAPPGDARIAPAASPIVEMVEGNPVVQFVLSELLAGLAAFCVNAIFRLLAYGSEQIASLFPLSAPQAVDLVTVTLGWTGAVAACVCFIIITIYQIWTLTTRLRERVRHSGRVQ